MTRIRSFLALAFLVSTLILLPTIGMSQGKKNKKNQAPAPTGDESTYYKILTFTPPEGQVLEAGAIEILPDDKVAVGTRRGEIWIIDNAYDPDPSKAKFSRFAHGLHEILGLSYRDGWLYVTHRPDVTRIKDTDGDGKADLFEIVAEGWEVKGDYHEYAFGSRFDKKGNIWIALCLTGSFSSDVKYRGWAGKITPEGKWVPTTSGVRSPGGIGLNADDDVFYTDNQGPWNGSCHLKHVTVGGFVGHPGGFKWYNEPDAKYLGPTPTLPKTKSRIVIEAKKIPQLIPPAVTFPYAKMGNSASGIDCDRSEEKFGPFVKQLFVGDQTHSTLMRVSLEKVGGRYQGACYPFRKGFGSGVVPVRQGKDGSFFVGGTNRGWGSHGNKKFAIERLVWTGKTPFEIQEMKAKPDGFELTFTKPINPMTVENPESYKMQAYTYIYQADYGSPVVDETKPTITKAVAGKDGKSVRLYVKGLVEGNVHELEASGVRSTDSEQLVHPRAYYTLNRIPE